MTAAEEFLGKDIAELDTPALLVDLDAFEANMRLLAGCCREHGIAWRPHSKAHKSPQVARLQLEAGACGITCAKLSEAELMAAHGIGDILIANQVVAPAKLARLAVLQQRARVLVTLDNPSVVPLMGRAAVAAGTAIPVLIEVDIGMNRCGVLPGGPVLELARAICATPGLDFRGLMGYEGHVLELQPPQAKVEACHRALSLLIEGRDLLQRHGIPVEIISAGGTGSFRITAAYPGITEIQAGGGIFMDAMYRHTCFVEDFHYALTILATITSRHAGHVIVDAGFKTMSAYHYPPQPLGREDLKLRYLSAEHGVFDILSGPGPRVGERLRFIVGYSDSTNCLHDRFLGIRRGKVELVWEILGRGLLT